METESIRWVTSDADMAVLPRGRHSLSPEAVKDSQRGRMLRAVALAVAEKGYGETVVTDVIERAHVSRKTFYEHFADLQDCFRQAHAAACDTLLAEVIGASRAGPQEGFETIRSGISGYFQLIAAEPEMFNIRPVKADVVPEGLRRAHGDFARRKAASLRREFGLTPPWPSSDGPRPEET